MRFATIASIRACVRPSPPRPSPLPSPSTCPSVSSRHVSVRLPLATACPLPHMSVLSPCIRPPPPVSARHDESSWSESSKNGCSASPTFFEFFFDAFAPPFLRRGAASSSLERPLFFGAAGFSSLGRCFLNFLVRMLVHDCHGSNGRRQSYSLRVRRRHHVLRIKYYPACRLCRSHRELLLEYDQCRSPRN